MSPRIPLATILLAALVAPLAAQQHCSQFHVSGSGHRDTMMTFSLTGGHPYGHAFMALSGQQGNANFNFGPMGMLQLGLAHPMYMLYMGEANGNGGFEMRARVPHHMMHRTQMFAQCFTGMIHAQPPCHGGSHFSFCTSNVMGFGLGGHGH